VYKKFESAPIDNKEDEDYISDFPLSHYIT